MKAFVALGTAVAITLGLCAWAGTQRANAGVIWVQTERSSRLLDRGRVRCTASVGSEVQVGHAVSVKFTLHNVSKHSVKVALWFSTGLVVKAADGTTYDPSALLDAFPGIPPPPPPRKLRAGATWHLGPEKVLVRWTGPLRITPKCLGNELRPLRVAVTAPMLRPVESAAVGEVVAAAGHLLDHCRPQTPGVAVEGQIYPPSGSGPPMDAQCSVSLSWDGNFLVAQTLVLIPPGLTGVQIYQPYETLWPITQFLPLTASPPYEAIAWEFVVTRDQANPIAWATVTATCDGGTGFSLGEAAAPDVVPVSACSG
jgi:hypothetical protein